MYHSVVYPTMKVVFLKGPHLGFRRCVVDIVLAFRQLFNIYNNVYHQSMASHKTPKHDPIKNGLFPKGGNFESPTPKHLPILECKNHNQDLKKVA